MISRNNNYHTLLIVNAFKIFSLLFLGAASFFISSCSTSKSAVDTGPKASTKDKVRQEIIEVARMQLGKPYLYAGSSPKGFDCSGFSYFVMKKNNIVLNRTSDQQARQGKAVSIKEAKEADLLFFGSRSKVTHVGIITANKKGKLVMIHSSSSKGIVEEDISASDYWQSRLLFAKDILN
jgi:cell wall-associated NlpC family hydrolase